MWYVVCRNSAVAINWRTWPARPLTVAYARMACATSLTAALAKAYEPQLLAPLKANDLGYLGLQLPP